MFSRSTVRLSSSCVCSCVLYHVNTSSSVWVDCSPPWLTSSSIASSIVTLLLATSESLSSETSGNISFKSSSLTFKCEVLDGWFVDEEHRSRELIPTLPRLLCRLLAERPHCPEREAVPEVVPGLSKSLSKICPDTVCPVCTPDLVPGGAELVPTPRCKALASGCENRSSSSALVPGHASVHSKDWLCALKSGSDTSLQQWMQVTLGVSSVTCITELSGRLLCMGLMYSTAEPTDDLKSCIP